MSQENENRKGDTRRRIQLPGDDRLVSDFADDLGKAVRDVNVFGRAGLVVIPNAEGNFVEKLDRKRFPTWIEDHVVCFRWDEGKRRLRTMSPDRAEVVLASSQFRQHLRPLARINPVRMPVLDRSGKLRLLEEGYDAETQTFTAIGGPKVMPSMPLDFARNILDDLLSEMPFADSGRSKAVHMAAMLSLYAGALVPAGALRPCFIYLANAPGAGKTLLAKFATVPVLGKFPDMAMPKDDDEMRKVLIAAIIDAKPAVIFDNVKGEIGSAALESFITSQSWSGRILGVSKIVEDNNYSTVFITGNGCTTSPDMRRRSLFCDLFIEEERAEDRQFTRPLELGDILADRSEILSALQGLVKYWDSIGRPKPSRRHSSFHQWAEVIGGIVEAAGYGCPLETPAMQSAGDATGSDMRILVEAILSEGRVMRLIDFADLVQVVQQNGLFEDMVPPCGDPDQRQRSVFGKLLRTFDRRIINGCRFTIEGRGHSRRFRVEKKTSMAAPGDMVEQGLTVPEENAENLINA